MMPPMGRSMERKCSMVSDALLLLPNGYAHKTCTVRECSYAALQMSSETNTPAGCEQFCDDRSTAGRLFCAAAICQGCQCPGSLFCNVRSVRPWPQRLRLQSQHATKPDSGDG